MIDMDDLDIFYKYDAGTFSLISGMFMIITVTYIIYAVSPKATDTTVFYYSIIGMALMVAAPVLFYISAIIEFHEILGKFSSGICLAAFGTLIYHVTQYFDIGSWLYPVPRIFVTGVLGFITSFLFVRGVGVQMVEESGGRIDFKDEEKDILQEDDEDKFLEEENEPW